MRKQKRVTKSVNIHTSLLCKFVSNCFRKTNYIFRKFNSFSYGKCHKFEVGPLHYGENHVKKGEIAKSESSYDVITPDMIIWQSQNFTPRCTLSINNNDLIIYKYLCSPSTWMQSTTIQMLILHDISHISINCHLGDKLQTIGTDVQRLCKKYLLLWTISLHLHKQKQSWLAHRKISIVDVNEDIVNTGTKDIDD